MSTPHAQTETQYFVQGYDDFKRTAFEARCPYAKFSFQYNQWRAGWRKALLESRKTTTERKH